MKLLIDADELGRLAENFRGMSTQLLDAAQTVRNDVWAQELCSRDTSVTASTEVTQSVANRFDKHAQEYDTQANELERIEDLVRGESEQASGLQPIDGVAWQSSFASVTALPAMTVNLTKRQRKAEAKRQKLLLQEQERARLDAVKARLTSVPDWKVQSDQSTVTKVQDALGPQQPPKKKKKGLFGKLFGGIGKIFKGIGSFFKKAWNKLKSVAKDLWKGLKTALKNVWTALKNMNWKQLLTLGVTAALQFIPGLGQAAAAAIFGAANAAKVVTIASGAWKVWNAGKAIYTTAKNGIKGLGGVLNLVGGVTGVLEGVGNFGGKIGAWAAKAAGTIRTTVANVTAWGKGIVDQVSTALGNIPKKIGQWIGNLIPKKGGLRDALTWVGKAAGDVSDWIKGVFKDVGKIVKDAEAWVAKLGEKAIDPFKKVIEGISDGVGSKNASLGGFFKHLFGAAITAGKLVVTSTWEDLKRIATEGLTGLQAVLTSPLDKIKAILTGDLNGYVSDAIRKAIDDSKLWSPVKKVRDTLAHWSDVLGSIPTRLQTITDGFTPTNAMLIEEIRKAVGLPAPEGTATPEVTDDSTDTPVTDDSTDTPVTDDSTDTPVSDTPVVEDAPEDSLETPGADTPETETPETETPETETPETDDALANNLNVITPSGAKAAAWISPVNDKQSSTVQGLLGLVDPTSDMSTNVRRLIAA